MSNTHFLGRQHPHSQVYNLTPVDELLCMNGTPWIFYVLEECVETVWEYYSIIIGLISMACFLLAILPQLYESYRNGRADEALSQGFLLCLLGGDLNNFAGCYLTNQLPIQLVTAISYVCMDIIMISQFLYYKLQNQKSQKSTLGSSSMRMGTVLIPTTFAVTSPNSSYLKSFLRQIEDLCA
ncbi:LAAT1 protein, partial [Polypterus senegalus]